MLELGIWAVDGEGWGTPLGYAFVARFVFAILDGQSLGLVFANGVVRITVLCLLAYFIAGTARRTQELERRVEGLVRMCAWSRTVELNGEWLSFEDYLMRRFNLETSHGISPAEGVRHFGGAERRSPFESDSRRSSTGNLPRSQKPIVT